MKILSDRHGSLRHSAAKLRIAAFGVLFVLNTHPAIAEENLAESFVLTESQMDKVTAGWVDGASLIISAYAFAHFCVLNCQPLYELYGGYKNLISEMYRINDGDPVAFKRELYAGPVNISENYRSNDRDPVAFKRELYAGPANISGGSLGSGYAGLGAGGGGGDSWGGAIDTTVTMPDSTNGGSTPTTNSPQNGSGGVIYIPIQIEQF